MSVLTCPRCRREYPAAAPDDSDVLLAVLGPAVLMAQTELRRESFARIQALAPEWGMTLASQADGLFGRAGRETEESRRLRREAFTALARGLAAASFLPGGVSILGEHWCDVHPESEGHDAVGSILDGLYERSLRSHLSDAATDAANDATEPSR